MNSKNMEGLKSVQVYIVFENEGLWPVYNITKYNAMK